MTDYSIPDGDLEEVARAFTQIADGEAVAFRTVDPHGRDGLQMVYGDLRKSSAYVAIPVHSYEDGWRLRKRCHLLTLDAIDQLKYTLEQLTVHPGLSPPIAGALHKPRTKPGAGLHLHYEHEDQIQRRRISQAHSRAPPRRRNPRPTLPPLRKPYRPHAPIHAPALIHRRPPRRHSKRRQPLRRARTRTPPLQLTTAKPTPASTNQKAENHPRMVTW